MTLLLCYVCGMAIGWVLNSIKARFDHIKYQNEEIKRLDDLIERLRR